MPLAVTQNVVFVPGRTSAARGSSTEKPGRVSSASAAPELVAKPNVFDTTTL